MPKKGEKMSIEDRKKRSDTWKKKFAEGYTFSKEQRRKISEARKKLNYPEKEKDRLRNLRKGIPHTEETKEKMRDAERSRRKDKKAWDYMLGNSYAFKGRRAKRTTGNKRAQKMFAITPCVDCGVLDKRPRMMVRHHINEDPLDNRPENVVVMCRSCHMKLHFHGGKSNKPKDKEVEDELKL